MKTAVLQLVLMAIFLSILVLFSAELIADFIYNQSRFSFKQPLFLAKLTTVIFILCPPLMQNHVRIFISVAYVYNSCEGQERMQLGIAFEIVDELGTCVLVVACCFVIATWTEIIEGVRSLSQNKVYYAKVRLALLLCALIVTAIDLLLVVLGHVVVEIFEVTSFFVNIVVCLFGLAILILNIINLARSFQFWSVAKGSRSMKSLRFRSYLLPLSAVGFGYITASIVGATMDSTSSPWRYFTFHVVYRVFEVLLLIMLFMFLQYYTYRGGCLRGFRADGHSPTGTFTGSLTGTGRSNVRGPSTASTKSATMSGDDRIDHSHKEMRPQQVKESSSEHSSSHDPMSFPPDTSDEVEVKERDLKASSKDKPASPPRGESKSDSSSIVASNKAAKKSDSSDIFSSTSS